MRSLWVPGWVQQPVRLHHLHVGQRQRGGLQPGSDAGICPETGLQVSHFCGTFTCLFLQVFISKEEIPVRGGDCVLCYFSSILQCIIGVSEPFKVS